VFLATSPNPGDIITEEWKQNNFGINCPETGTLADMQQYQLKMLSAMDNFKSILLEHYQIHLKAIGQGSHVVLPPEEQTQEAWTNGVNDIKRAFRKMGTALVNVDVTQITNEQRKENTDAQVRLAMMTGMFKRARKNMLSE
jgi:phage terminase small subunit